MSLFWLLITVWAVAVFFVCRWVWVATQNRPLCVGCGNGEPTHIHPDGGPGGVCETCFYRKTWG